jgi:SNF2 family DNA or RNA helicase
MNILHAHWDPPRNPAESGGMFLWSEDSDSPAPARGRGRPAAAPRAKAHPFYGSISKLRSLLGINGKEQSLTLRLPSTRSGPVPSPQLPHAWELDLDTPPFLAPWTVQSIRISPVQAFQVLTQHPTRQQPEQQLTASRMGADALYWSRAAWLCLEILASQKLLPVLSQAGAEICQARWMPLSDSPLDSQRLTQLEAAMPAVCRAGTGRQSVESLSPHELLASFLNVCCDALARHWGQARAPRLGRGKSDPAYRWIEALFSVDPTLRVSAAQAQALAASQKAWLRNLEAVGGTAYRIAFRLHAPQIKDDPDQPVKSEARWELEYLLQARDDPSLLVPSKEVWKTRGGALTRLKRRFEAPQEKLLAGLGYAARLFPPLQESLKVARPTRTSLDTRSAYSFLREAAPLLEGAGFGLLVPPWWNKPGWRLGARLRIKTTPGKGGETSQRGIMTLDNLLDYRWELSVGETSLTEEEFRSLAALKSPLVQIRGQWVQLDAEQVEAAIRFWEKQALEGQMSLLEAVRLELDGKTLENGLPVEGIIPEGWLAEWLERFKQPECLSELDQPQGLMGELRPYQRRGYSWLHFLRSAGLGSCLADDMGLGKTIQTIALLLREKEELGSLPGPSLLVCPTSVVANWERELLRFAPSISTLVHQGASRARGEALVLAAQEVDVVLTSYALARLDAESMQSIDWLYVILDEAQNIKNPTSKQAQAVRKMPSSYRLALTGTPVENRLSELWSIMHFLNPGYLGSRQAFRREFAAPIERYNDENALARLKQLVKPLVLRRVKTDPSVIQDLPEKVETIAYCRLTEEQATLYEAVVQDAIQSIESLEGIQRRGLILSMLMQLKQICNHPVQYLHQSAQGGEQDGNLVKRSGKLERLGEMLEEVLAEGDRCLIFTQFAEMGQILAGCLPGMTGAAVQYLHGGTPAKIRDQMVRRFQEDRHAPPIFILSLKAGGTGLNLTAANHVFHFDRWWNPAVEDQATDRAFRIGQVRNVQVHKFVTTGTLEERIDDMIESKKGLAQAVLASGEGWLTELSTAELRELVLLRRTWDEP